MVGNDNSHRLRRFECGAARGDAGPLPGFGSPHDVCESAVGRRDSAPTSRRRSRWRRDPCTQAYVEVRGFVLGPPKSRAGRRVVALPQAVVPALRRHLADYAGQGPDSFVFTGPTGATIWRSNFNKLVGWKASTTKIGYPNLHVHDLRHTGNKLASRTGASLRELMTRMGHDSPRAALIYQHAIRDADRAITRRSTSRFGRLRSGRLATVVGPTAMARQTSRPPMANGTSGQNDHYGQAPKG